MTFSVGDGSLGLPEHAPFDHILVTAAAPSVPPSLKAQLRDGGRLVIPVGDRQYQQLVTLEKRAEGWLKEAVTGCVFVPLLGSQGWEE